MSLPCSIKAFARVRSEEQHAGHVLTSNPLAKHAFSWELADSTAETAMLEDNRVLFQHSHPGKPQPPSHLKGNFFLSLIPN
jgi:hypothetical protein